MTSDLLDRLAAKAHDHRLVPFLGAGCSLGHLSVDWDGIAQKMAAAIPAAASHGSNDAIAEAFAAIHGNEGLTDFLKQHLLITDFDDGRDTIPLQVLALELLSLYTTNQDNVVEVASVKVGRPRHTVATIDDIAALRPGEPVLYKFHGSLDHPDSLVFTSSQYAARLADPTHFMNIRLRSDALTKSFLFIGYSFRDANIQGLFAELAAQFSTSLPGSFLLAYKWSKDLDDLCRQHGIECVDPGEHIPAPTGEPAKDLEVFLRELCERMFGLSIGTQLEMFGRRVPTHTRVAIRPQVDALLKAAFSSAPSEALSVFRGACDAAMIPVALQGQVSDALVEIMRKAGPEHVAELSGALFNLRLPVEMMFEPAAAFVALANRIPMNDGPFGTHHLPGNTWPPEFLPLAAARAIELLDSWKEEIGDNFKSRTDEWFDRHWQVLPEVMKVWIRPIIEDVWARRFTTYEQPVIRAERLAATPGYDAIPPPSFGKIRDQLVTTFPKRFKVPAEG